MKYSTLFLGLLLTGLISAGIVVSGGFGRSAGASNVSAPIKVYSAEKKDFIISETVIKTNEEWKKY